MLTSHSRLHAVAWSLRSAAGPACCSAGRSPSIALRAASHAVESAFRHADTASPASHVALSKPAVARAMVSAGAESRLAGSGGLPGLQDVVRLLSGHQLLAAASATRPTLAGPTRERCLPERYSLGSAVPVAARRTAPIAAVSVPGLDSQAAVRDEYAHDWQHPRLAGRRLSPGGVAQDAHLPVAPAARSAPQPVLPCQRRGDHDRHIPGILLQSPAHGAVPSRCHCVPVAHVLAGDARPLLRSVPARAPVVRAASGL